MTDEDLLALCILEEAGGEIPDGKAAVASVLPNLFLYELIFPNGKRYIGVCRNIKNRWKAHKYSSLRRRISRVHFAINKYGHENIRMRALAFGEHGYILDSEYRAIECLRTREKNFGYNVAFGGSLNPMDVPEIREKMRQTKLTPESRARSSAVHKGKKLTPEQSARHSAIRLGKKMKPHSLESRMIRSIKQTGRRHTQEAIQKMRESAITRNAVKYLRGLS